MVPGGTVAPRKVGEGKFDRYGEINPPQTSEGKSPTPSYGIGWPSKSDKTFEQLFGNLNLGTFSSE